VLKVILKMIVICMVLVRSNIENTTVKTSVNGPSCDETNKRKVSWANVVSGKSNEESMRYTNDLIQLS